MAKALGCQCSNSLATVSTVVVSTHGPSYTVEESGMRLTAATLMNFPPDIGYSAICCNDPHQHTFEKG